tara:strand:+ start:6266 stop:7054 length:789 start_codon:yes stop_codon:yes gene_type:complete
VSFEEHLKLFNIFHFKSFDEIENFAYSNWSKPTKDELKFLNQRKKADPSSSFIDNLKFYGAVGKSEILQSLILSERYGSYESSSNFVIENLNGFKTILDIGCSIGYLTTYYALKIPESSFIGIDFSFESVKKANNMKKKLNLNNIDFMVRDMNKINYPNKYFDCIVDTQSIYYSKDYLKTFNHLRKILSDNGILITIPGIGEKDLIKQYINQIQNAGFSIINFKFIETTNLGEKEYLPTITCSLKKPKENINIDHVINKLFN